MNHECCNEICCLTSCQLASPLCTADADTRFAVHRYDRQAREEAEQQRAIKREEYPKAILRHRRRPEVSALGLRKYDRRVTRGMGIR